MWERGLVTLEQDLSYKIKKKARVIFVALVKKYGITYIFQLPPSSGSFYRSYSDYQWLLTTNKQHLQAQKNGKFYGKGDSMP